YYQKKANLISRILYPLAFGERLLSFIWACHHWQARAVYPLRSPPSRPRRENGMETSSPLVSATYLTFQPPGFTAMHVTIQSRRLLPHVFTLIPPEARRYIFCGTFRIAPHGATLPVRKRGALRCPDFPPSRRGGRAIEQVCHVQRYVIKPYLCLP